MTQPIPLSLDAVTPQGDLLRRLALNWQRLHDEPYRFDALAQAFTAPDAPGDWIGRTILGLTLLAQVTKWAPRYLDEIIQRLPELLNEQGYIGSILPAGIVNEGQLAGHNALLRGLSEYYFWQADPQVALLIRRIVENLVIPAQGAFATYPDHPLPAQSQSASAQIAHPVATTEQWQGLSTDIGQVFMILDGATQAYGIVPSKELHHSITTIIARFRQI